MEANIITYNKDILIDEVCTKKEAEALSSAVFHPSLLTERARLLLIDFIEEKIASESGRESLIYDAKFRPELLIAKLESIADELSEAVKMLDECLTFHEEFGEEDEREEEIA